MEGNGPASARRLLNLDDVVAFRAGSRLARRQASTHILDLVTAPSTSHPPKTRTWIVPVVAARAH
jgi:hypothetical protein